MSSEPTFRPVVLTGSCHCSRMKFLVTMQMPTSSCPAKFSDPAEAINTSGGQRYYKCNCTTCHKMGFLHYRPVNQSGDFYVISPMDSEACDGLGNGMSSYACFEKRIKWYFCQECGVRPFAAAGEFEVVEKEIDVPVTGTAKDEYKVKKETRKVWKLKDQQNNEERSYLSINLVTIDANQPGGFDLRDMNDRGVWQYLDWLADTKERSDKPWPGGMY